MELFVLRKPATTIRFRIIVFLLGAAVSAIAKTFPISVRMRILIFQNLPNLHVSAVLHNMVASVLP